MNFNTLCKYSLKHASIAVIIRSVLHVHDIQLFENKIDIKKELSPMQECNVRYNKFWKLKMFTKTEDHFT